LLAGCFLQAANEQHACGKNFFIVADSLFVAVVLIKQMESMQVLALVRPGMMIAHQRL